jgi:hypothetical protein
MPRQPKLRKKKVGKCTYWYTKSGGDTYFGRVEDVSSADASRAFCQHIRSLPDTPEDGKRKPLSAPVGCQATAWRREI